MSETEATFPDEAHDRIEGEYTNAATAAEVEDKTLAYLEAMTNHEGFEAPIRAMPDAHPEPNSETVIGFTMPFMGKISPSVVSPDIGCGMLSWCFGPDLGMGLAELDDAIRESVPMGQGEMNTGGYHLANEFPWGTANKQLGYMMGRVDVPPDELSEYLPNAEYDIDYVKALCERVGYSVNDVINGVGSLGEGNHFIEVAQSEATDVYWATIHSGSRGIGYSVNDYWMDVAADRLHKASEAERVRRHLERYPDELLTRDPEVLTDDELLSWVQGGLGGDFVDMAEVRDRFSPDDTYAIEPVRKEIKSLLPIETDGQPYDYLEGDDAVGYLIDMLFAQQYALENRYEMMRRVESCIGVEHTDEISSPHNYIDPKDMIIRKGATPARDGERGVIPLNMRDGILVVEGKGNEQWNVSAPHGAGRARGRRESRQMLTLDDFEEAMDGIYSSSVEEYTLDEHPAAYKDAAIIIDHIDPMADITDKLVPILSVKAHAPPWFRSEDEDEEDEERTPTFDDEHTNWLRPDTDDSADGEDEQKTTTTLKISGKSGSRYLLVHESESLDEPANLKTPARVLDTDSGILFEPQWIGSILKFSPYFEEMDPDPTLLKDLLRDVEVRGPPKDEIGTPIQEQG